MKKLLIPFFLFLVAIAACKKDEPPAVVEETPLTSFLADSTVQFTRIIFLGRYDVGFSFQALKPGKITKVSYSLDNLVRPGTYQVTIWDVDTKRPVVRKMVEATTANARTWVDIAPLVLVPFKEYRITADQAYAHRYVSSKVRGTALLPLVKGNIKILKNVVSPIYQSPSLSGYPEPFSTDDPKILYHPADFTFVAD
jgi:hypothetical protein